MKSGSIIAVLFLMCALAGCSNRHDKRVETAYALAATEPTAALDSIAALDSLKLSRSDRMLLGLARIKATDKAYLDLPGDSAALPLVDYYSHHETDRFYPEALYYAGRIYCESGDSPNALRYFQDALDLLPENTTHQVLRASVLSQTAGILGRLRLIDEAIPYFKEVFTIDSLIKDTINLIYDCQDIASNLIFSGRNEDALQFIDYGTSLTIPNHPDETAPIKVLRSRALLNLGNIKEALDNIRNIPEIIDVSLRENALATAIQTYYKNGIFDTAFIYAEELRTIAKNPNNKRMALYYLIQEPLSYLSLSDSLNKYHKEYLSATESFLSKSNKEAIIAQNSYYNYATHERQRNAAERERTKWFIVALILIVTLTTLIIIVLFISNQNHKRELKLKEALYKIEELQNRITILSILGKGDQSGKVVKDENLRDAMQAQLIELAKLSLNNYVIPDAIRTSTSYLKLNELISSNKVIKEDVIWSELEEAVKTASPKFKDNLLLLNGSNLRTVDFRTILLIKAGYRPSEIQTLLGLTKGSVSSRRAEISKRLFGKQYELKIVDAAIRVL